jgi:hypothetical protein
MNGFMRRRQVWRACAAAPPLHDPRRRKNLKRGSRGVLKAGDRNESNAQVGRG